MRKKIWAAYKICHGWKIDDLNEYLWVTGMGFFTCLLTDRRVSWYLYCEYHYPNDFLGVYLSSYFFDFIL